VLVQIVVGLFDLSRLRLIFELPFLTAKNYLNLAMLDGLNSWDKKFRPWNPVSAGYLETPAWVRLKNWPLGHYLVHPLPFPTTLSPLVAICVDKDLYNQYLQMILLRNIDFNFYFIV